MYVGKANKIKIKIKVQKYFSQNNISKGNNIKTLGIVDAFRRPIYLKKAHFEKSAHKRLSYQLVVEISSSIEVIYSYKTIKPMIYWSIYKKEQIKEI